MLTVKMSSKNQIVIPGEARRKLALKSGDRLKVLVQGDTICLVKEPESYVEKLYGSGKGIYDDRYLAAERETWQQ